MAPKERAVNPVLNHLRHLAAREQAATLADRELLRRFLADRDETAFAAIVDRHGPLLLHVARRAVSDPQEAEDVLQATFLVLVRQAHTIRRPEALGSWLYGVVRKLAAKARQRRVPEPLTSATTPTETLRLDESWQILDEELARLPDKYRAPLLLCCIEAKTRDEAAVQLGWRPGAVKIRLERGRELLRQRLARRGFTLPTVFAGLLWTTTGQAVLSVRLAAHVTQTCQQHATGTPLVGLVPTTVATLVTQSVGPVSVWPWALVAIVVVVGGLGLRESWRPASTPTTPTPPVAPLASTTVAQAPPPTTPRVRPPDAERIPPAPETSLPEGATVVAQVRSVHPKGTTITLRVGEADRTYALAPTTTFLNDEAPSTRLRPVAGQRVEATLTPDQRTVVRLRVVGPLKAGTVREYDPMTQTLTVLFRNDSKTQTQTVQLTPATVVLHGDRPATLDDIHVQQRVSVQLSHDETKALRLIIRER